MIYLIDNNEISYNSDDCTLSHIPTGETVKLSITSGRLLEVFLTSDGSVLDRDTMLKEVWDLYGLQGSNNNLNQYISILRRAFAGWGCNNFIITIPKVGFRLNPDITIVCRHVHVSDEKSVDYNHKIKKTQESEPTKRNPMSISIGRFFITAIIFMGTIVAAACVFLSKDFTNKDITPVSLVFPEGCELIFLKNTNSVERQSMEKQLKEILIENKLACNAYARIYLVNYTFLSTQNLGRTMVSYCKLSDKKNVISCDNFYYQDWRNL